MKLKMLTGLTIIFISLSLTGCLSSVNLAEGITNFKQQNFRQAFIRLMPEAQKGNPDAQYAVGYMYYYGQGVTEDRVKAMQWIHAAAQAGQIDAIKALKLIKHKPYPGKKNLRRLTGKDPY